MQRDRQIADLAPVRGGAVSCGDALGEAVGVGTPVTMSSASQAEVDDLSLASSSVRSSTA